LDIRGLARHLNLSIGTVSRALNGRAGVNADTRKRVLDAAALHNYAPNQSGRSLRKGTTHAIAFLLQPHPGNNQYGEPFFVPLLKGLQAGFAERGLELIAVMDQPGGDQDRLRRIVEARWADAIILAWTRRRDPRIEYLVDVGFPFATLGRSGSGGRSFPSLDLDFARAGRESVARFASKFTRRRS
jgi:DNA-binding LacI/PurR family transcriptional regulator